MKKGKPRRGGPLGLGGASKKCPVCGAYFSMRGCRLDEWGPVYDRTPLCSIPCMRAYEAVVFAKSVKRVAGLKAWRIRKALASGTSHREICRTFGITDETISSTVTNLELLYWKEIEWLEIHGEEAAG